MDDRRTSSATLSARQVVAVIRHSLESQSQIWKKARNIGRQWHKVAQHSSSLSDNAGEEAGRGRGALLVIWQLPLQGIARPEMQLWSVQQVRDLLIECAGVHIITKQIQSLLNAALQIHHFQTVSNVQARCNAMTDSPDVDTWLCKALTASSTAA